MEERGPEIQRWTAKRKAAVVLEVLKGKITGVRYIRLLRGGKAICGL